MSGDPYRDERRDLDPQGYGPQGEWEEQPAPPEPDETQASGQRAARPPLPPATKWLLIAVGNVGVDLGA